MKDEEIRFIIGSGGSKRIWTSMLQVISNIIDFNMNPGEAVEAPRIHWDGTLTQIEPGFQSGVLSEIGKRWPTNIWDVKNMYFGGAHVVSASGEGAADSRRDGTACY
jgi:gamma-glutamyltranspeptidase/glutathione hydrolase